MKYLKQFGIILAIYFVGIIINKTIINSIPSTVIGMLILFIFLILKLIKIESIKEFSEFMLMNLAFFFIPPSVTLIKSWDILSSNLWKILFIIISTTFITMIVTGLVTDLLIKLKEKKDESTK